VLIEVSELAGLVAVTTATSTVDEIVEQIVGAVRRPQA
jgi:ammonia channel protein AmtB